MKNCLLTFLILKNQTQNISITSLYSVKQDNKSTLQNQKEKEV